MNDYCKTYFDTCSKAGFFRFPSGHRSAFRDFLYSLKPLNSTKEGKMRESVKIDGVTLTREQVERAAAELNKPEPKPRFTGGELVHWPRRYHNGRPFLVCGRRLTEIVHKGGGGYGWPQPDGITKVQITNGIDTWDVFPADLILATRYETK